MGCDDYRVVQGDIVSIDKVVPDHPQGKKKAPLTMAEAGIQIVDIMHAMDPTASPVDSILIRHLPEMIALFRAKARDYQAEGVFTADALGARGQFADLWRKVPKLKKSMWDGEELVGEQAEEILMDFFGHIMLAIGYLNGTR